MKQAKVLTDREFNCLLAAIDKRQFPHRNRAAIMLSHFAGLRVGEIASLRVSDVYTAGKVKDRIFLRSSVTKSGEARGIFISDKLRLEMERYASTFITLPPGATPLLPTRFGKPFSPNTLCQLFGRLYAAANIDGATSHSGRRWFITKLAHKGVSPKVIMTLAGHKNLSTTQRYIEVNDDLMRAAVGML
jgi:integrase/recombinase XerD